MEVLVRLNILPRRHRFRRRNVNGFQKDGGSEGFICFEVSNGGEEFSWSMLIENGAAEC